MSILKRFLPILLLVGLVFGSSGCSGQAAASYAMGSEAMMPSFLSDAPPKVREAYQFAMANPHDLETIPCFCGCGKMGHKSNWNCIKELTRFFGMIGIQLVFLIHLMQETSIILICL